MRMLSAWTIASSDGFEGQMASTHFGEVKRTSICVDMLMILDEKSPATMPIIAHADDNRIGSQE
jgi:hypothetical protein